MKMYVGVTDYDWYRNLSVPPTPDEVNFWKPGGEVSFKVLEPGELFLFKLKAPRNFIVGGALFAHFSRLPCSLAWDAFEQRNGTHNFSEFRSKIEELKRVRGSGEDYVIGCILLEQPFFFSERDWIATPDEFNKHVVAGMGFDTTTLAGRKLWDDVQVRLAARTIDRTMIANAVATPTSPRYGEPITVFPRLGQGSFRVMVTDAYARRCAATGEKTLPVLEAAHIRPYAEQGEHRVDNGLLLRSDLHTLYDRGYLTVTPEYRIEVSGRIRDEFKNGREYYALHGKRIALPERVEERPKADSLEWHCDFVFRR